jgi:hypothetical protein
MIMREDMFKVIVERPRLGRSMRKMNRMRSKEAGENQPSKIGVRRQRGHNRTRTKHLNENLAPLKRYLGKQVGRPWNKVYSDICANLSPGNVVQQHVLEHLGDFVLQPVIGRNGEWVWGNRFWMRFEPRPGQMYVHPRDGLLKRWKVKRGQSGSRRRTVWDDQAT